MSSVYATEFRSQKDTHTLESISLDINIEKKTGLARMCNWIHEYIALAATRFNNIDWNFIVSMGMPIRALAIGMNECRFAHWRECLCLAMENYLFQIEWVTDPLADKNIRFDARILPEYIPIALICFSCSRFLASSAWAELRHSRRELTKHTFEPFFHETVNSNMYDVQYAKCL